MDKDKLASQLEEGEDIIHHQLLASYEQGTIDDQKNEVEKKVRIAMNKKVGEAQGYDFSCAFFITENHNPFRS
ncbi:hypothetical protein JCM19046_343 [Bacillus sp. JCM 19046]|nr:hypothetical protein JCM19046_343 [Bacillus sp. JCM 19046]